MPPQARHYAIVTYFKPIVASINYLKPIVFTIVDMSIVDTRSPIESAVLGGLLGCPQAGEGPSKILYVPYSRAHVHVPLNYTASSRNVDLSLTTAPPFP